MDSKATAWSCCPGYREPSVRFSFVPGRMKQDELKYRFASVPVHVGSGSVPGHRYERRSGMLSFATAGNFVAICFVQCPVSLPWLQANSFFIFSPCKLLRLFVFFVVRNDIRVHPCFIGKMN